MDLESVESFAIEPDEEEVARNSQTIAQLIAGADSARLNRDRLIVRSATVVADEFRCVLLDGRIYMRPVTYRDRCSDFSANFWLLHQSMSFFRNRWEAFNIHSLLYSERDGGETLICEHNYLHGGTFGVVADLTEVLAMDDKSAFVDRHQCEGDLHWRDFRSLPRLQMQNMYYELERMRTWPFSIEIVCSRSSLRSVRALIARDQFPLNWFREIVKYCIDNPDPRATAHLLPVAEAESEGSEADGSEAESEGSESESETESEAESEGSETEPECESEDSEPSSKRRRR